MQGRSDLWSGTIHYRHGNDTTSIGEVDRGAIVDRRLVECCGASCGEHGIEIYTSQSHEILLGSRVGISLGPSLSSIRCSKRTRPYLIKTAYRCMCTDRHGQRLSGRLVWGLASSSQYQKWPTVTTIISPRVESGKLFHGCSESLRRATARV